MKVKALGSQSHLQLNTGMPQPSAWFIVGTNGTFAFYHSCQKKYICSRKVLDTPHRIMALIRQFDIQKCQRWSSGIFWLWLPGLLKAQNTLSSLPTLLHFSSQAWWGQMHNRCCKCPTKWAPHICPDVLCTLSEDLSRWGPSSPYKFTALFTSHFLISLLQIYSSAVKKKKKKI